MSILHPAASSSRSTSHTRPARPPGTLGRQLRWLARLGSVAVVVYLALFSGSNISAAYFNAETTLELAQRLCPAIGLVGLVLALAAGRLGGLAALVGGLGFFAIGITQGGTWSAPPPNHWSLPLAGPLGKAWIIHAIWATGTLHVLGSFMHTPKQTTH